MKSPRASAVPALISALFLCSDALALTPVKDNFNEPELNGKRWKLVESGNARLRHSDGSLHFTVGKESSKQADFAYVELRNNQPGYNENWMLRLNAHNISGNGERAGVGFWIFNADDPKDFVRFQLFSTRENPEARQVARASFRFNDALVEKQLQRVVRNREDADLIVTFNKESKLFTFYWGYFESTIVEDRWIWRKIGTFSPTGDGGDAQANWNMNSGSGRFGIRLAGTGNDEEVKKGQARIAYFALKTSTKLPD